MLLKKYMAIADNLPHAFAYHKIENDNEGNLADYSFMYVNKAFEKMTNLKKEDIIGKKVTSVLPSINNTKFNWIETYIKVAMSKESINFKQFSKPLNKWYNVWAFSDEKGYFATLFYEITDEIEEKNYLKQIIEISKLYLSESKPSKNYDHLVNTVTKISGAKYVGLNLYNIDNTTFKTVAISGIPSHIKKASNILGFNLCGKFWSHDERRTKIIEGNELTEFKTLTDLTGSVLPKLLVKRLTKMFNVEKAYIFKISKDNIILGDFTIMMPSKKDIENIDYIRILAALTGQYIEQKKTKEELATKTQELEDFFNVTLDLLCIADTDGNFIRLNKEWGKVLGYPIDEIKNKKIFDFVHPDDLKPTIEALDELDDQKDVLNFTNRYRAADGSYKYIQWKSHPKGKLIYAAARDITENKKIENSLKESESRFRQYTNKAPVGIFVTDIKGNFSTVNNKLCKMSGYSKKELLKMSISDFLAADYRDEGQSIFEMVNDEGKMNCNILSKKKTGEEYWINLSTAKLNQNEIIGFTQDITAKKIAEKKLISEHNQILSIFDNMEALIYVTDLDSYKILFVNEYGKNIYGNIQDKVCYSEFKKGQPLPCDICPIKDLDKNNLSKKIKREYKSEITNRWYACQDSLISWTDNKYAKLHVAYDITNRKHAEAKDRFISAAMKNSFDSVIMTDENFKITYVNRSTESLFLYKEKELIDKKVDFLYPKLDQEILRNEVFPKLKKGNEYFGKLNNQKKDGTKFICELKVAPIKDKQGNPYAYIGIQRDITNQVKLEEESYLERERFRTTLLSVGDGIIATDNEGMITVINEVAEQLTSWKRKDALGKPLLKVFNIINEYSKVPCNDLAKEVLLTGKIQELENHTCLVTKKGDEIPIEDSAAPIKDKNGKITGVVIVFRDFTEKREKQKEVEYLSFHDHLTSLYNRRYLEDALKRMDVQKNLPFTIIVIDVNGLKLTNDAYGHTVGDKLLKKVSQILRESCSRDDIISRTGGDEFVILLPKTDKSKASAIKEKIKKLASESKLDSIIISLAVGFSTKTKVEQDIWEIQNQADSRMYKDKLIHGKLMRSKTIETVLRNINNKYDKEQLHTERVSQYCVAIGKELGFNKDEIQKIRAAGVLHDIGKITISPDILNKKEKLNLNEWEIIKQHTVTGYNIVKGVEEYASLGEVVLHHHEHYDGSGYPAGIKGSEIPLYSRIICIADAYEAIMADRSYQRKKSSIEAVKELKRCAGTQFDPDLVDIFVNKVLKYTNL